MATTIERGETRGTPRTMAREAVSAYLDVAASSARLGPIVLADVFLAGAWAVGATSVLAVLGTVLVAPLGLWIPGAGLVLDAVIWIVAFAIPVACHRYCEHPERARDRREEGVR